MTTMTRTEYKPEHLRDVPWSDAAYGVVKCRILDVDTSVKVLLSILAFVYIPPLVWLFETFTIVSGAVVAFLCLTLSVFLLTRVWVEISSKRACPLSRGINDEIRDVYDTYKRLYDMKKLIPEGSGMIERIDEYGRLAFGLLQEVDRLPDVGGAHTVAYRMKNEVQIEMKRLVDSGNELVDLIATQRTTNTKEAISHLGIHEYAERISLAMSAYRELEAGETATRDPKKIVVDGKKASDGLPLKGTR